MTLTFELELYSVKMNKLVKYISRGSFSSKPVVHTQTTHRKIALQMGSIVAVHVGDHGSEGEMTRGQEGGIGRLS